MLASLAASIEPKKLLGLARASRVHAQLDWWHLEEWMDSDALVVAREGAAICGAMLPVPATMDESRRLSSSRSDAAWLRWCAVADGVGASAVMRSLFAQSRARLSDCGVRELFCATQPSSWLWPYLGDAGFALSEEVVTFVRSLDAAVSPVTIGALKLRAVTVADLDAVARLDNDAFDELWHYSREVLARALGGGNVFRVAELDGELGGYYFAGVADGTAHLTRVAVRPSLRRRGIGRALVHDAMAQARGRGAHAMTLNTQLSNAPSQRLYETLGFRRVGKSLKIMRLEL